MIRFGLLLAFLAAGVPWTDRVRTGNDLARAGGTGAEPHYESAEQLTDDPGLIAFNRAALLFARGEYRDAELDYLRCLDDQDIPSERRRQALYNRGVCLVHRGDGARIYRTAIRCFEECLDGSTVDDELARNARHNLELAKLLWNRERSRRPDPPTPNESLPEEQPRPKPMSPSVETDPGEANPQATANASTAASGTEPKPMGTAGTAAEQPRPGAGTLPVPKDEADVQRLTPEDTRTLLERTAARLKAARRQNELLRAGPERPNVRDW